MIFAIAWFLFVLVFCITDVMFYNRAKWPERRETGNWPGSGFVAYYKTRKK